MLICFGATNSFSNVSPEKEFFENTEDQGEIVIVFENLNMKLFAEFDQAITSIKGIKNTGYCQQLNCYYFSYEKSMFRSADEAYVEICKAAKNFLPIYKEGTTSEMVIKACTNLQN
jgi:hypothetical protein